MEVGPLRKNFLGSFLENRMVMGYYICHLLVLSYCSFIERMTKTYTDGRPSTTLALIWLKHPCLEVFRIF